MTKNTIYALCGLPGAGKSTVAEMGTEQTDGSLVHVGSVMRTLAEHHYGYRPSSQEIADFAAEQREERGSGFAMDYVVGENSEYDKQPVFVDSVRNIEGFRRLEQADGNAYLVWVEARDFDQRLERLQQRARDDEGTFTIPDLLDRDDTELNDLGQATILESGAIDYRINNSGTYEELQSQVSSLIGET